MKQENIISSQSVQATQQECGGQTCSCDNENAEVDVYIKRLNEKNPLPEYKSEQASGMDVYANLPDGEEVIIGPGEYKTIPVGIATVIPEGFDVSLRGRSGLAFKHGILAHWGTIDADYRGEYGVILFNLGRKSFPVKNGDRIAQIVLQRVPRMNLIEVDNLEDVSLVNRGGGFGHTGIN